MKSERMRGAPLLAAKRRDCIHALGLRGRKHKPIDNNRLRAERSVATLGSRQRNESANSENSKLHGGPARLADDSIQRNDQADTKRHKNASV